MDDAFSEEKSKEDNFAQQLRRLQGTTVLVEPRVSREVIIESIRDNTFILREHRNDIRALSKSINALVEEQERARLKIEFLESESKKQKAEVSNLNQQNVQIREEMARQAEQIEDLLLLKKDFKIMRENLDDLTSRFKVYTEEMDIYKEKTSARMDKCEKICADTQFKLKELREYMDKYADTLILPSNQIRVESSAGFSNKPLTLLDVLGRCNQSIQDLEKLSTNHDELLITHTQQIENKAELSLAVDVNNLEKKVFKVEDILRKEEEQGVGAIRKQCETLVQDFQSITTELQDKADKQSVAIIVHEKYEEIVTYLKDALQSSTEDEASFKAKSDELHDLIYKLSTSKLDRAEILPMQELMVRTESTLRGFAGQQKSVEGKKEVLTRTEVLALLEMKVDKVDFEKQILDTIVSTKGGKRGISLAGKGKRIVDEALVAQEAKEKSDRDAWKGIAFAMKEEAEAAARQASMSRSTEVSQFGDYVKNKRAQQGQLPNKSTLLSQSGRQTASVGQMSMISMPPGGFRPATEGGRSQGGSMDFSSAFNENTQNISEARISSTNSLGSHNSRVQTAPQLRPITAAADMTDHIDSGDFVLRGSDGKLYHGDDELNSSGKIAQGEGYILTNLPTAKGLTPSTR